MRRNEIIKTNARHFRSNQKNYFDLLDNGNKVIVSRGQKNYVLSAITDDELYFTPIMNARITKSMQQIQEGESIKVNNKNDLLKLLDSL